MTTTYDPEANAMSVTVSQEPIASTLEIAPGVILDFAESGAVVAVEVLDVSDRMDVSGLLNASGVRLLGGNNS